MNTESRPSAKESDEYYELWRDAEICDLLLAHEIEVCDDAIEMLRDDLSVAETAFVYCTREDRPLKRRDAQALIGACTRVLELADGTNLASPDDLCSVREIRQRAQVAMLTNNAPGPTARRWLWPVCVDLRHSWRLLRPHLAPTGIYDRGGPSPLLVFLTDCCRLVDPSVNEAAILKAYKHRDIDAAVLNPPQEDV